MKTATPAYPCDLTTRDAFRQRRAPSGVVASARPRNVVPAPRGRLVRRTIDAMRGCVVAKRYRITRGIGAGGMGTVFEAIDLQTGCEVALKLLPRVDGNAVPLKRLRREAETAVAVRSDYVCHVHYLGVEGGTPFIVMERLHGEPLQTRISDGGPLPLPDAFAITCQLLDALSATHASGVIHRDVKPGNLFVTSARGEPPRIKLIDFGVAKVLHAEEDTGSLPRPVGMNITAPDGIPGTLSYLAPEQLLGAPDLDQRVDVYAAGLAFYEMLTGGLPFRGASLDETVRRIVFDPLPPLSGLRDDLPPDLDDVLAMALAKDRGRRFLTAAAFRRALCAACEDHLARAGRSASFRADARTLVDSEEEGSTDIFLPIDVD